MPGARSKEVWAVPILGVLRNMQRSNMYMSRVAFTYLSKVLLLWRHGDSVLRECLSPLCTRLPHIMF